MDIGESSSSSSSGRHMVFKDSSWFSQFRNGSNPWMARYVYALIFLVATLLAWAARDYGLTVLSEMDSKIAWILTQSHSVFFSFLFSISINNDQWLLFKLLYICGSWCVWSVVVRNFRPILTVQAPFRAWFSLNINFLSKAVNWACILVGTDAIGFRMPLSYTVG